MKFNLRNVASIIALSFSFIASAEQSNRIYRVDGGYVDDNGLFYRVRRDQRGEEYLERDSTGDRARRQSDKGEPVKPIQAKPEEGSTPVSATKPDNKDPKGGNKYGPLPDSPEDKALLGHWSSYGKAWKEFDLRNRDLDFEFEPAKTPWLIYLHKGLGPCRACADLKSDLSNPKVKDLLSGFLLTQVDSGSPSYTNVSNWLVKSGYIDPGETDPPLVVIVDGVNTRVVLGGMFADGTNMIRFIKDEVVVRPVGCTYRPPHKGDSGRPEFRPERKTRTSQGSSESAASGKAQD